MDQKINKPELVPGDVLEATKFYEMIMKIMEKGNDAEVKKIKGKLKVVEIRKQTVSEFEVRRLLAKNFIESHEDLIGEVVEYKDDGYTGLNFDRPAFQQMITDAKRGIIGTIIVKDFSRFGRDYIGVGDYLEQILPSLGVRLIAVNSKYDSQEQGSNVLSLDVSINNMINNMYSKDLSKKLKSSFRAKWSDGKNPSAEYPFGYYAEKSDHHCVLRIDEEAAPTVRLIFELAIKGYSTKDIAEHLNKNEILTPNMYFAKKGKKKLPPNIYNLSEQLWNTSRVRNILKMMLTQTEIRRLSTSLSVSLKFAVNMNMNSAKTERL